VSSLGPRYAECSFTNFNVYEETTDEDRPSQRQVLDQIQAFAAEAPDRLAQGGGVVLFGKPGTGKDHLLCALAYWVVLCHGFTVRWTGGPELFERARDRIRDDSEAEREMISEYCKTQILIISDPVPAKGNISQYSADIVQRIVDKRYRSLKSTWATMNVHDGEEAEQRLASPIVDRLRHHALCLKCMWPSFRKPN
jgi:DNA replication protein DnaC